MEGRRVRISRDETSTAELLRAHVEAVEGATGGPLHIHARQEEAFIVLTGRLLVRRGRERIHVEPGQEARIPPGVRHTFAAEVASTYTVEFRPALRTEEFFRDLFALPIGKRGRPEHRGHRTPVARIPGRVPVLRVHPDARAARAGGAALVALTSRLTGAIPRSSATARLRHRSEARARSL
jgi:quercetin dioxygenase-like cupin family protein